MWLRNICKKFFISALIGIYLATVLWITLFSRIGAGYRAFLFPFQSYIDAFSGNWRTLEEGIENIILFIPYGLILGAVKRWDKKRVIILGLGTSLSIELLQAILALGAFEFDDLIHNTWGTVIGYWCIKKTRFRIEIKRSQLLVLIIVLFLAIASPLSFQSAKYQRMARLEALHNSENGAENMLVLNGKSGNIPETDVYVSTLADGSVSIKGSSDKKAWWRSGRMILGSGSYVFSGLSNVDKDTVGLVLETDNHRIIDDVGPVEKRNFELSDTKELIAYGIVYPDCDCDVIATPEIYKEG